MAASAAGYKPNLAGGNSYIRPQIRALLDRSGLGYRYLPPYSPDLNPIEPAWAKVKATLRRIAVRTAGALHEALGPALAGVTAQDAAGFFRYCGYTRPK